MYLFSKSLKFHLKTEVIFIIKMKNRGNSSEKETADYLQGSFNVQNSKGLDLLKSISNEDLKNESIEDLCRILSILINKPFTRNSKRRKALMIKWIDDYYDLCEPYVNQLSFICMDA